MELGDTMSHRCGLACALLLAVTFATLPPSLAAPTGGDDEISAELRSALTAAMGEKIKELKEVKDERGKSIKRASG